MPLIGKKKQSGKNSGFFKALDFYRTVFFDHFPDLFHPLDREHPCFSKIVFWSIFILIQKCVVLCIKGIYGVQKTGKMIVYISTSDKRISVCIRFHP